MIFFFKSAKLLVSFSVLAVKWELQQECQLMQPAWTTGWCDHSVWSGPYSLKKIDWCGLSWSWVFCPSDSASPPSSLPQNHHPYIGQETLKFKSSASAKVWQAVCHGKSGLESAHLSQGCSGPSTTQTASTVSSDGLVIFVKFVICDIVQVLLELIKDCRSWVQLYLILYSTAVSVWSCELCAVVFYNLMRCCTVTVERPCFCQQLFISQVWNWNWKLLRKA